MMKIVVCVFASLGLVSNSGFACNEIEGLDSNYDLSINANPQLTIRVQRNQNTTNCEFYVTVDKGQYNDGTYNRFLKGGNDQLPIDIRDATNSYTLLALPEASPPSNVLTGSYTNSGQNNQQLISYRLNMGPITQATSSGNYQNSWRIRLYSRPIGGTTYTFKNESGIGARYFMRNNLNVSVVPTGGAFNASDVTETLNFGNLALNAIRGADILVQGNTDFRLTLSSFNNGKLRRAGGTTNTVDTISYQVSGSIAGGSGSTVVNSFPYTSPNINQPSGTLRMPVSVKITEDPALKAPGTYSDTITISLSAN